MERLFVDTSAWLGYVNRLDPGHRGIEEVLSGFRGRLVTSNFVFDETVTLCHHRLGHEVAMVVGDRLTDGANVDLVRVTVADERDAWQLFKSRSDKRYSFTDCTSFVMMRRLGVRTAVALDADFERDGFALLPRS